MIRVTASDKAFAEKISDAYSTDRYQGGWARSIRMLRNRGYGDRAIEAIIRSKHTRWAGDAVSKDSGVTAEDLESYLNAHPISATAIAELIAGTFETEANDVR